MISELGSSYRNPNATEADRLLKACKDFEGIFTQQMFKTMRAASFESDLIKKSQGEKVFTDMMDAEIAGMASTRSTGGVGEILFEQLKIMLPDQKLTEETGKKFLDSHGSEAFIELKRRGMGL